MPINPDGTITSIIERVNEPKHVTRVTVEFTYRCRPEEAQNIHDSVTGMVRTTINEVHDFLIFTGVPADASIANAKNPQPVLPEGEGAQEGGSVSGAR